jgi:hypothetical protein
VTGLFVSFVLGAVWGLALAYVWKDELFGNVRREP